ncbi:MAG: HD domain-containing protein [Candidatus Aegiribacteria sp.]|nr:HD domain-containing protein [Candidatus Aegiribacteria sp.]MBD3295026.1 HD domain-containing protein [Candidatus Fermentibacteria bacterium]
MNKNRARKVMYIRDPVHGSIRLSRVQEELIKTVEVQRLSFIHQLGTTFQSYPGAHGMRLSHALGVSYLAGAIGESVLEREAGFSDSEKAHMVELLQAAGLLHDIGHTPWSHTLEPLYLEITGKDHMDLVSDVITGNSRLGIEGDGKIPGILEKYDLEPVDVAGLINSEYKGPRFLQQLIFGEVDADMLDYLQRDFYFTGVAYGHIEVDRIISTMRIAHDQLVFQTKGHEAIRDFLFARMQMYASVYLHKKTRIVDMMLLAAARRSILELGELDDFHIMTDDELLSFLLKASTDEWVREMAWRIKYRQKLFSRVFRIDAANLDQSDISFLNSLGSSGETAAARSKNLAMNLAETAGVDPRYILVDMPLEAVAISEERFTRLDIRYVDKSGGIIPLNKIDPAFSEYLSKARPNRNFLTVCCCPDIRTEVQKACEELFHRAVMPLFPENRNE